MVYLGPQQCKKASCFLDGNILLDIEEINFDDIDPATEDVRFRAGEIKTIDVELKGRGIQSKARKPNAQLEIRLPIKDDVQAIWKFRGLLTRKQDTLTSATTPFLHHKIVIARVHTILKHKLFHIQKNVSKREHIPFPPLSCNQHATPFVS